MARVAIPESTINALLRYVNGHIETGGFLRAVLENNLRDSFIKADMFNEAALREIVAWLYTKAPSGCWGSPEKVQKWIDARATERT